MSHWQKLHERDPKGDYVKVTNNTGKSFFCKNDQEAQWLIKILKQADKPEG